MSWWGKTNTFFRFCLWLQKVSNPVCILFFGLNCLYLVRRVDKVNLGTNAFCKFYYLFIFFKHRFKLAIHVLFHSIYVYFLNFNESFLYFFFKLLITIKSTNKLRLFNLFFKFHTIYEGRERN